MSIKYKRLFQAFSALFIIGILVTLPIMVNLILYSIDPATNYYYGNTKLVSVLNCILIVLTVAFIIPVFLKSAGSFNILKNTKQKVLSAFAVIFAVALCFSSAYDLLMTFNSAGGAGAFLTGVFGFLAAIFFFVFANLKYSGKSQDVRLFALMPVVWGVVNLVATYMKLTQVANISVYLYKVLQMVFAILFLYYHARLTGGVTNRREINGVFAFGLPCAFYGLAATVPYYIAHIINSSRGRLPQTDDFAFLSLSLYIIVLLASLMFKKDEPGIAEEEVIDSVAKNEN